DLPKLFKMDVSFTTKGTAKETGTGLGLILCKELVERQGGEIWAESRKNIGTAFYFKLPYEKV
ncbi:MAG: sensor histidine kinase, partial [Ignavibacteria bacterium]